MKFLSLSALLPIGFLLTAVYVATTRRHRPPWRCGVLLLLVCALITFAHFMQAASAELAGKVFWFKINQVGWAMAPTVFLWLALHYSGHYQWLTRRTLLALSVVPVLRIALTFTNASHGLMWDVQSTEPIVRSLRSLPADATGVVYWVIVGYSYVVLVIGCALLGRLLIHSRGMYRRQSLAIMAAAAAAAAGVGLDVFQWSPLAPFVATQIGLGSGIISASLALGFLRRTDLLVASRESILNTINDIIIVVDTEGRLAEVNTTAARLLNLPRSELIGGAVRDLLPELPDLALGKSGEVRMSRNSRDRVYDLRTSTMMDMRNQMVGRVIVLRDITARKKSEERVQRLNEELERRVRERTETLQLANKELNTFTYSVSHDLRSPLRLIDGYSRILKEDYLKNLDDRGTDMFRVIQDETRRMGLLIDSLLALSRTGRAAISHSPFDMAAMVTEIFETETTAEQRKHVAFSVGPLPCAHGDPVLIRQIWSNLLSNAVKFSAGVDVPTVRVSASTGQSENTYVVSDNGAGFDMKYAAKLFGVFQRLHNAPRYPGAGVGLAIVHRIVQRHGGRVWAEAELEKGATFRFTLPVAESSNRPCNDALAPGAVQDG